MRYRQTDEHTLFIDNFQVEVECYLHLSSHLRGDEVISEDYMYDGDFEIICCTDMETDIECSLPNEYMVYLETELLSLYEL